MSERTRCDHCDHVLGATSAIFATSELPPDRRFGYREAEADQEVVRLARSLRPEAPRLIVAFWAGIVVGLLVAVVAIAFR